MSTSIRSIEDHLPDSLHWKIQFTQRYAHINDDELDKGYYEIFEKKGTVNDPQ